VRDGRSAPEQNPDARRKAFVSDAIGMTKTVTATADNVITIYLDGVLQASTNNWGGAVTFTFTPSTYGTHVIAIEATNQGGAGGVIVDVR
jgi:hypothetical protein